LMYPFPLPLLLVCFRPRLCLLPPRCFVLCSLMKFMAREVCVVTEARSSYLTQHTNLKSKPHGYETDLWSQQRYS
jgi:hypothetical protein